MDRLFVLTRRLQHGIGARVFTARSMSKSSSGSSSSSSDDEKKIETISTKKDQSQLSSNSSSSSSEDEAKVAAKKRSEDALQKLNNLLNLMIQDNTTKTEKTLDLAKPINRRKKPTAKVDKKEAAAPEKKLSSAAKDLAESLGGDVEKTESELLKKLLETTKAEISLKEVLKGISIKRDGDAIGMTRAEQVKQLLKKNERMGGSRLRARQPQANLERVNLFRTESLGIFTKKPLSEGVLNNTWDKLYERDLKLAVTHPPTNYFQQMILWTDQKKVWRFPIDNEQDIGDEKNVSFDQHVFLEKHLEPWCPHKGPIRHFMELVCVGLSKNPFLTVETKKEHILWFKKYLEDKQSLLKDVGLSLRSNELQQEQKKIEES